MDNSTKKVVILTGSTGTLGSALIERLTSDYHIVGIARRKPIAPVHDQVKFFQGDICLDSNRLVDFALETFNQIDIVINNAVYSNWAELKQFSASDLLHQYKTNVVAPIELANEVLRKYWLDQGVSSNTHSNRMVINISSTAGVKNYFGYGQGGYASTKAALNTLTQHLAYEWSSHGIKVNAVAPTSFPSIVSTGRVVQEIIEILGSTETGKISIIDQHI